MITALWICIGMVVCGVTALIIDKVSNIQFEKEWRRLERHRIHNHFLVEMARVQNGD